MPLLETLTIEVGTSIAKTILKRWLKDSSVVSDTSTSIMDILKTKTLDRIAQNKAQRQLQEIGEKVGESFLPIFEAEGAKLDERTCTAIALAVAETLNSTTGEILAQHNLEPAKLAKYLVEHSVATQHFNETEKSLFQRIVFESCEYIVDIATQLPNLLSALFQRFLSVRTNFSILPSRLW